MPFARLFASFIFLMTVSGSFGPKMPSPLSFVSASGDEAVPSVYTLTTNGEESYNKGKDLFDEGSYMLASRYFWRAVLLQANSDKSYTVEEAYSSFMQCYAVLDKAVDGFVFVADESFNRGQKDMAEKYLIGNMEEDAEGADVISPTSPLGAALDGASAGDTITYDAPNGSLTVTVLDVATA